jgi:hypothetical protein
LIQPVHSIDSFRRWLVVGRSSTRVRTQRVVVAGAALALAGSALGTVTAAQPAAAAPSYRMLLRFDSAETLRANTTVTDTSGYGRHGVVRAAYGGTLLPVSGFLGTRSARFPSPCSASSCPNVMIEVADSAWLDPGYASFQFGTRLRMSSAQTSSGSNVLQKGLSGNSGGQWKLQVDGKAGKPSCVVSGYRSGSYARVTVVSSVSVSDDRWHSVICQRSSTGVAIYVDWVLRGYARMAPVSLSSTAPVTIGAKYVTVHANDQYHGQLDDVFMRLL